MGNTGMRAMHPAKLFHADGEYAFTNVKMHMMNRLFQ